MRPILLACLVLLMALLVGGQVAVVALNAQNLRRVRQ